MRETWYVLEDGTAVHPGEVAIDDKGSLNHKGGLVAMRDAVTPMTRGVDVDDAGKPADPLAPKAVVKDQKPEPNKAGGYKTRETKAR